MLYDTQYRRWLHLIYDESDRDLLLCLETKEVGLNSELYQEIAGSSLDLHELEHISLFGFWIESALQVLVERD